MIQEKQSAGAFEGNPTDTTYTLIIAFCTGLEVKLATYLRGLA